MIRKIIILTILFIPVILLKVTIAQKAPISVSPLARVKVSDVYDPKKYDNPFMSPKARKALKYTPKKPAVKTKKQVKRFMVFNEPTVNSLRLTGIMLSGSEKQALLYDLNTRQTYFLIRGKLYDRDIKVVRGFTGKVLSQSVVLEKGNQKRTIALPGSGR